MVLSRADETYDFARHQTRHQQRRAPLRFRQGSRWAHLAAEEYDYDDEEQTYEDGGVGAG